MKFLNAILAILLTLTPVMAAATMNTTWSGSGSLEAHFVAGNDAHSDFWTSGSFISGQFFGKDFDDNPYNYQVDTVETQINAQVSNGGFLEFQNIRDESKTSMYGNAGQRTYSYIYTNDGVAEMAWFSRTNYADMSNCQYAKPSTTSGKNFEVNGSNYYLEHSVTDSDNDGSMILAYGSGSAKVKLQGEKSNGSNFNMGSLDVCGDGCAWKNNYATFAGTGTGDFEVHSWADNSITVGCPGSGCSGSWSIPGDGSDNSAQYDLHVGYSGTWTYSDFGVRGN